MRLSNLIKIKQRICDFYTDVICQTLDDKLIPDINAIAKDSDLDQLNLLLQLVLSCVINCHRNEFIEKILTLDQNAQLHLMDCIRQLKLAVEPIEPDLDEEDDKQKKLEDALKDKELLIEKCHELEIRNQKLENEKFYLLQENEKLSQQLPSSLSSGANSLHEETFQKLQHRIESLQNDLYKMEEANEEYRITNVRLQEEINNLRQANDQIKQKISDYQSMKDELESLKYLYEENERLKRINDGQRKKIEEFQDNRRQLRLVEEKNTSLMKNKIQLEDEMKKLLSLKSQIEVYKKQMNELRSKVTDEKCRADKFEYEFDKTNEKFVFLLQEKEGLLNEVKSLKLALKQNKDFNNDFDKLHSIDGPANHFGNFDPINFPENENNGFDYKEKLVQVEIENEILRNKIKDSENEKIKLLESQLQDEKDRNIDLESKNRSFNQRIIELEDKIKDLQTKDSTIRSGDMVKSFDQINTLEEIIRQKDSVIDSIKNELHDAEQENLNFKSILAKKEEDLAESDARYKMYVAKAKEVIGTFEPRSIEDANQLLKQTQDQFIELQNEFENYKTIKEMEQKLMTIAFHNLVSD